MLGYAASPASYLTRISQGRSSFLLDSSFLVGFASSDPVPGPHQFSWLDIEEVVQEVLEAELNCLQNNLTQLS